MAQYSVPALLCQRKCHIHPLFYVSVPSWLHKKIILQNQDFLWWGSLALFFVVCFFFQTCGIMETLQWPKGKVSGKRRTSPSPDHFHPQEPRSRSTFICPAASQSWEQHLCTESGIWLVVCLPAFLTNIRESCAWIRKWLSRAAD